MKRLSYLVAAGFLISCGGSTADPSIDSVADSAGVTDAGADGPSETAIVADSSPTETLVDSGKPDASADSPSDAPKVCSAIDPGPGVTVQGVASAPVAFTSGGTILPGTYVITEAIDYTGTGGMAGPRGTMRRTMMFTATTYETARRDNDGATETFAGTWVYGTSGAGKPTWQPTDTCPGTTGTTFGASYEATPTTLKMFVGSGVEGVVRLITMTKK